MKQFPAALYSNFSSGPKQFSLHPTSPDNSRRQVYLVRIPEEPVNFLHCYVHTSFGSPVKILALSLLTNRPESEARHYLLQTFPCDEFYLCTPTCLHNILHKQKDTFSYSGPFPRWVSFIKYISFFAYFRYNLQFSTVKATNNLLVLKRITVHDVFLDVN